MTQYTNSSTVNGTYAYKVFDNGLYVATKVQNADSTWSIYVYAEDFKTVYIIENATIELADVETFEDVSGLINKAYTFAGWYVQTFDRNTNKWSEMTCMSTNMDKPFISTATTDTNIVGLFAAVTNVSYIYNPDKVTVTFDSSLDSCNKPVQVTTDGLNEKISGWFYYCSAPTILVAPTGGYRIADTYKVSKNGATSEEISYTSVDHPVGFLHYNETTYEYENVDFSTLSLTDVSYIQYNLITLMPVVGANKTALLTCDITIEMEFVVLTHFTIEGFISENEDRVNECITDVALYTQNKATPNALPEVMHAYFVSNGTSEPYYSYNLNYFAADGTPLVFGDGLDSAHNKIGCELDGGSNLVIYGYFDYDKYAAVDATHELRIGIYYTSGDGSYNTDELSDKEYSTWYTNGTSFTSGKLTTASTIPTGVHEEYLISNEKAVEIYDYENSAKNESCLLSENNHALLLVARRSYSTSLKVSEEFYKIDDSGFVQKIEYNAEETPLIPITLNYNCNYYGSSADANELEDPATNGSVIFNKESAGIYDYVTYRFERKETAGSSISTYLSMTIDSKYQYFKYTSPSGTYYYKFVGFRFPSNDPNVESQIKPENTNMYYNYKDLPGGSIAAVFIQILPIQIEVSSGGSFNVVSTSDRLDDHEVFEYVYEEVSTKDYVNLPLGRLNSYANIEFNGTDVTENVINTGFNYVIKGSNVVINPVASSGYTIPNNGALYKNDKVADFTNIELDGMKFNTSGNSVSYSSSTPYIVDVTHYNREYNFKFSFTNAYIVTFKQYKLSSNSASAISVLFTGRTSALISENKLFDDTDSDGIIDWFANTTLSYGNLENFNFDYEENSKPFMTGNYGLNSDFYIYYIAEGSATFDGFYENGQLLVSVDDLQAKTITLRDDAGNLIDYTLYYTTYKSIVGRDTGVTHDLSLEVRFSSSVFVQSAITGLEASAGIYPYESVFDTSMVVDGKFKIATYVGSSGGNEEHFVTLTTDKSEITEISSGSAIQYTIKTTTSTQYSFINYFFYKRYEASRFGFDGLWLKFNYNANTYYYYNGVIYTGPGVNYSTVPLTATYEESRDESNNTVYTVLIEESISYTEQARISISSLMVDNAVTEMDPETEEMKTFVRIYAKFAQVTTVTFTKSVEGFIHIDDQGFATENSEEFMSYFDAGITFTNPNGNTKYDVLGNESLSKTITIAKLSSVTVFPYIAPHVSNRYITADLIKVFDGTNNVISQINIINGCFVLNTSNTLSSYTRLYLKINYFASYTVVLEKTINGQTSDSSVDGNSYQDLEPFINVKSYAEYSNGDEKLVDDNNYLSYVDYYSTTTNIDGRITNIKYVNDDTMSLTYPIHRSVLSGEKYTSQTLTTSLINDVKSDAVYKNLGLVFYGWYLNGYLYSTDNSIIMPFSEVISASPTAPETNGYVIIYNNNNTTTKVVAAVVPLAYDKENNKYMFTFDGGTYDIPNGKELENFTGKISGVIDYEYVYMSSDNIKFTAAYGSFVEVSYDTNVHNKSDDVIVSSTVSGNLLGMTTTNESLANSSYTADNKHHLMTNPGYFATLVDSKKTATNLSANGDYRLSNAITSHEMESIMKEDGSGNYVSGSVVYALSGSNMLVTAGHLIGYRVTGFTYSATVVTPKIDPTALLDITLSGKKEVYTYTSKIENNISINSISGTTVMGYVPISEGNIILDLKITAHYERAYQVNSFVSTIDDYDDNNTSTYDKPVGGTLKISSYEGDNPSNVEDGTFFSPTYNYLVIKCTPASSDYIFAGLFLDGIYLGINTEISPSVYFGMETYGKTDNIVLNLNTFFFENPEYTAAGGKEIKDITIEARFIKLIKYSIRLSIGDTFSRSLIKNTYGIDESAKYDFDVKIKLSNIYSKVFYGASSGEEVSSDVVAKGVWDKTFTKVKVGDRYKTTNVYSTSKDEVIEYTFDPNDTIWNHDGKNYVATEENNLYVVSDSYLLIEFYATYGSHIELGLVDADGETVHFHNGKNSKYAFSGWYIYKENHSALSTSALSYDLTYDFFATSDYYGNANNIVAKYVQLDQLNDSRPTPTDPQKPTTSFDVIDEVKENGSPVVITESSITETSFKNNILYLDGRQYLFTGWWQQVTDASRPSTYILLSNNYYDKDLPTITNKVARFVRLKEMSITIPAINSGYVQSTINYRYYYTQISTIDNRIQIQTINNHENDTVTISFVVPIDTYINGATLHAWEGHYYTIKDSLSTDNYDGTNNPYTISPSDRLYNSIGSRYVQQSVKYVEYNSSIYYLSEDGKLYHSIRSELDQIILSDLITDVDSSVEDYEVVGTNVKIKAVGALEYEARTIETVSFIVYNGNIFYIHDDKLYTTIEKDAASMITPSDLGDKYYIVRNGVVIIETESRLTPQQGSSPVLIQSANKAGIHFNVESDYEILSILGSGHSVSYLVTTIESDGSYGSTSDGIVGGSIVSATIQTAGGTISPNYHTYSDAYPYLNIKVTPASNYTFIGLFINGDYVENSYNNTSILVNLSKYSKDVIVEAKFARNVSLTYTIAVGGNDGYHEDKDYIENLGLDKKLALDVTISNIYNSLNAFYTLGNEVYSHQTNITDISIHKKANYFVFTITVPYGTRVRAGLKTELLADTSPRYRLYGWYLLENSSIASSKRLVATATTNFFDVYAVENVKDSLSFVAKISTSIPTDRDENTQKVEVYSYNDSLQDIVDPEEFEYIPFLIEYSLQENSNPHITIKGKKYLFTGWWQILNDTTSILVSNDFLAPSKGNCVARFIEYRDIVINYSDASSVAFMANLHVAFNYIQPSVTSSVLKATTVNNNQFVITTTVCSAIKNLSLLAQNSYTFKDESGNYGEIDAIQDLELLLHSATYNNEITISSNEADPANFYVRYSRIYQDNIKFIENVDIANSKDKVVISILDNYNSFKVTIVAENSSNTDGTTKFNAISSIIVTSNTIREENSSQNQYFENTTEFIYDSNKTYYKKGNKFYNVLKSMKVMLDTSTGSYYIEHIDNNPVYIYNELGTLEIYNNVKSFNTIIGSDGRYYISTDGTNRIRVDEIDGNYITGGSDTVIFQNADKSKVILYYNRLNDSVLSKNTNEDIEYNDTLLELTYDKFTLYAYYNEEKSYKYYGNKIYNISLYQNKSDFAVIHDETEDKYYVNVPNIGNKRVQDLKEEDFYNLVGTIYAFAKMASDNSKLYIFYNAKNVNDVSFDNSVLASDYLEVFYNESYHYLVSSENSKLVITNGVVERYYPRYTHITVTLAKEYRNESFVGFKIKYDSGTSTLYRVSDVGYSFSLAVSESVTICAVFEDAVINAQSAIKNPTTGSTGSGYGSTTGGYGANEVSYETIISAPANTFIYSFKVYVGGTLYTVTWNHQTNSFDDGRLKVDYPGVDVINYFKTRQATDDFGQQFPTEIMIRGTSSDACIVGYEDIQATQINKNLYTLNITVTQNDSSAECHAIKLLYPYSVVHEIQDMTYTHVDYKTHLNNERLMAYLGVIKANLARFNNPEIASGIHFFDTMPTNFIDGFYQIELTGNAERAKLDGKWSEVYNKFVIEGTDVDGNVLIIQEGTPNYNILYNFQTKGTIRVYVHPKYYISGEYKYDERRSALLSAISEIEMLGGSLIPENDDYRNYAIKIGNTLANANYTVTMGYDEDQSRTPGSTTGAKGVYYFDILYFFSEPLSLSFSSGYFEFARYYSINGTTIKELKLTELPLKTDNSVLSISYAEYNNNEFMTLSADGRTRILHCDVQESIKSTNIRFNFNNTEENIAPEFALKVEMNGKTYTANEIIRFNNASSKVILLTDTTNSSNTITISTYCKTDMESDYPYIVQLIYEQSLISNSAMFIVDMLNFERRSTYSGGGTYDSDAYVHVCDFKSYVLDFTTAYLLNSTEIMQTFEDGTNPQLRWTMNVDFADGNEVVVETSKYFYINFSKNSLYEDATNYELEPKIHLKIYNPSNPYVEIASLTTKDTNGTTSGGGIWNISAYVKEGYLVNVLAEAGNDSMPGRSDLPNIYYHDSKAARISEYINGSYQTTLTGTYDGLDFSLSNTNVYKVLTEAIVNGYNTYNDGLFADFFINSKISNAQVFSHIKKLTNSAAETLISQGYTYVPVQNRFYLADYFDVEATEDANRIVGIIAPGNASPYEIVNPEKLYDTVSNNGYNFIIAEEKINSPVTIVQKYTSSNKIYSQYELMEENKQLYLNEGEDTEHDRVDSLEFPEFANNVITYYTYGAVKQQLLLAKTQPSVHGVFTNYYKQATLPVESIGVVMDYIYNSSFTPYKLYTGADGSDISTLELYEIAVDGTLKKTSDVTASENKAYFEKQTINKVLHGMTLTYNEHEYYIINGTIYSSYYTENSIEYNAYDLSVRFNPAIEGFYIAVDYENYEATIYPLKYNFTGYTYSNKKLINSNTGAEIPSNGYALTYNSTYGLLLNVAGVEGVLSAESVELIKDSASHYSLENGITQTIKVNIFDTRNIELTLNNTSSKLEKLNPEETVNSNQEITYSSETRHKVYYFIDDNNMKFYIKGNKIYKDIFCTIEADVLETSFSSIDFTYTDVVINGYSYSISNGIVDVNGTEYHVLNGELTDGTNPVENIEYKLINLTLVMDGVKVITPAEEEIIADKITIDNFTYYAYGNKLYTNYPFNANSEVDNVTDIISDETLLSEKNNSKYILNDYYVAPNSITYNGDSYQLYSHDHDETFVYVKTGGAEIVYDYATDTLYQNDGITPIESHLYNVPDKLALLYKKYATMEYVSFPQIIYIDTEAYYYVENSYNLEPDYVRYKREGSGAVYEYKYKVKGTKALYDSSGMKVEESLYALSSAEYKICITRDDITDWIYQSSTKSYIHYTISETTTNFVNLGIGGSNNYTNATLNSVTANAHEGYYIKGFVALTDIQAKTMTSLWLNYKEDAMNQLNGLQNNEYYSYLTFNNFISIDYSIFENNTYASPFKLNKSGSGEILSVTYTFDAKIYGNMRIYAVYAPVVYSIQIKQYNVQEFLVGEELKVQDLYEKIFEEDGEETHSGYIKGTLLSEYEGSTWLNVNAYNGNTFFGYSLGKDSDMSSVQTMYSSSNISNKTTIDDILAEIKDENDAYIDNTEKGYSVENLETMQQNSPLTDDKVYFMNNQQLQHVINGYYGMLKFDEDNLGSARNHIFFFDITNNITLNLYFKSVSYKLEINIGESDAGIYEGDGKSEDTLKEDEYLSYSDPTKDNPLSGDHKTTYSYSELNTVNNDEIKTEILSISPVSKLDPLVYTVYDSTGNLITTKDGSVKVATPTPIMTNLIDFELSRKFNFLVYKKAGKDFFTNSNGKFTANGQYNTHFVPSIHGIDIDSENNFTPGVTSSVTIKERSYAVNNVSHDGVTFNYINYNSSIYVILANLVYYVENASNTLNNGRIVDTSAKLVYYLYKTIPYYETDSYLE